MEESKRLPFDSNVCDSSLKVEYTNEGTVKMFIGISRCEKPKKTKLVEMSREKRDKKDSNFKLYEQNFSKFERE